MDGVLVIDKPAGLTSHDVVAVARRCLGERRIGHTGTLDPLATGVLPLACGRATRLVRFLSGASKDYEAAIRFGVTTDTYDVTGTETGRTARAPAIEAVESALQALRGDYTQVPPAFSAKKVDGRRAYAMARAQQAVALEPVPVRVWRADVLSLHDDLGTFAITCSAGFYVRAFAHALGQLVGTGACLEALRRTRSGEFTIDRTVTIADVQRDPRAAAAGLQPMDGLLPGIPAVRLDDEGERRVAHGRVVTVEHYTSVAPGSAPAEAPTDAADGWVRLLDRQGRLAAMGRPVDPPGALHPSVVLI